MDILPGYLTVLAGPMFAGKTEAFISLAEAVPEAQRSVYKPVIDTRHGEGYIQSHGGKRIPAKWTDLQLEGVEKRANIFIDEAQFLGPSAAVRVQELLRGGSNVTLAGLDLDYRALPFGLMPYFLALANRVVKLSGKCSRCEKPSSRTYRTIQKSGTVLVGGSEAYEPRCLACFLL